jgi:hypothetical protein
MQFAPIVKAATKILPILPWEQINKRKPIPLNHKYKHFKGGVYTVLLEQVRTETTGDLLTVYRGSDGTVWARPSSEFHGYVNGARRFKPIMSGETDEQNQT